MSYDTIKSRNERASKDWAAFAAWVDNKQPEVGDVVYCHNELSCLYGLSAVVMKLEAYGPAARLDFGRNIPVPGQRGEFRRVWFLPLKELKFTAPPKLSKSKRP